MALSEEESDPDMSDTPIEDVLAQLKAKDFSIRREGVTRLREIADASTIVAIVAILQDPDWTIRARAAEALGELRDASAVSMLIEILKCQKETEGDTEFHRRHAFDCAARALGQIGDAAGVRVLLRMSEEKDFAIRLRGVRGLLEAKEASAVPTLLRMRHTRDFSERLSVIRALADSRDALAVPALIEMIQNGTMASVQVAAAEALLALGNSETLPRRILACQRYTPQQRIDLLYTLRRVRYKSNVPHTVTVRYTFPDVRTLCLLVLKEPNATARTGARTVLNWLEGDRDLVIASERPTIDSSAGLLRAVQGPLTETRAETLLLPSEAPGGSDPQTDSD
jgi:hypothetical protein